ncbi:hypothetical protein LTR17_024564 [Elasticomyces elasticus]|nr:hypothetical protein LTR17_024564 [Elasticomyces elasticus]
MRRLHDYGEYSDLTVTCGSFSYFNANKQQEGEENLINLAAQSPDPAADNIGLDDPQAVRLMINYIYYGDYAVESILAGNTAESDSFTPVHADDRTLSTHAKVYAAAVKYGLKSLEALSKGYYLHLILRTECSVLDMAEAITTIYPWAPSHFVELREATSIHLLHRRALLEDDRIINAMDKAEGAWKQIILDASDMIVMGHQKS